MDLSQPISSVIPSGHGIVLSVLARTERPLSGRRVTELANGTISQSRVNDILRELTRAGIAHCEDQPPAKLYTLNRDHVAAEAIVALASLRATVLERMRASLARWNPSPIAVWIFGSFARGDGDDASDIDVLVVGPDTLDTEDALWSAQVDALAADVRSWSGNRCSIIELSEREMADLTARGERLAHDVRRDGIRLAGDPLPSGHLDGRH